MAFKLFSENPKDPFSIQLNFTDVPNNEDPNKGVFKQLLIIFTDGMKFLYGDNDGKVNLANLDEDDFLLMKKYFRSFGYDIF